MILARNYCFDRLTATIGCSFSFSPSETEPVVNVPEQERADYDKRLQAMEEGGHAAGLIRIYMAVANASGDIKRLHFEIADKIAKTHKVLSKMRPSKFKKIMHEQTALLQANEDKAIEALSVLIKDKHDRTGSVEYRPQAVLRSTVLAMTPKRICWIRSKKG